MLSVILCSIVCETQAMVGGVHCGAGPVYPRKRWWKEFTAALGMCTLASGGGRSSLRRLACVPSQAVVGGVHCGAWPVYPRKRWWEA